ncbi:hypothetical protein D3C81_1677190 [compost metagenome]
MEHGHLPRLGGRQLSDLQFHRAFYGDTAPAYTELYHGPMVRQRDQPPGLRHQSGNRTPEDGQGHIREYDSGQNERRYGPQL